MGCPAGSQLDELLKVCLPNPDRKPQKTTGSADTPRLGLGQTGQGQTEQGQREQGNRYPGGRQCSITEAPPVLRDSTEAPTQHASAVIPSVWILAVVVMNGCILALFLWFIIHRRRTRRAHAAADAEAAPADGEAEISRGVPPVGRADSLEVEREGPPTSCPHLNGGPKGLLKQEVPTCRDASECDAGGWGNAHVSNGRKDHGIPLPATELGDAALVTAKTAQYA